ncbi:MAG: hypothetical protein FJ379_00755 [Verrucomicrobia bacterium]|nr:hypothetical protein [Verrucomicrobiota bacterium]
MPDARQARGVRSIAGWRRHVRKALDAGARSPFYLFASAPYGAAIDRLKGLDYGKPARFWLSAKTQPLPALWRWWRPRGGIEVVSEFEFRGALQAGFGPDQILVNGPAKHRWLPGVSRKGLRVHFDSLGELEALLPIARKDRWRVGLRLRTPVEVDAEDPGWAYPFGLEPTEFPAALARLVGQGLEAESVHIHLKTNLPDVATIRRGFEAIVQVCRDTGWRPRCIDVGGGLAPAGPRGLDGTRFGAGLGVESYTAEVRGLVARMPWVEEVWLEHGRHPAADSGVLVVGVLDVKERLGRRLLICDGGRTLQAMVSVWEEHDLEVLEARRGRTVPTAVHGPTCMAFDCLGRRDLPASVRPGDHLVWFDAGAYHLSWETRFSHGLAEVWWDEGSGPRCVRSAERFDRAAALWR